MKIARLGLLGFFLWAFVTLAQVTPTPQPDPPVDAPSAPSIDSPTGVPASQPDVPPEKVISDTGYFVAARGPHESTWQRVVELLDENGETYTRTNSYVELASGLNTLNEKGAFVPAVAVFEIAPEGAVARQTAHSVVLAASPTDPNPVDLTMPDHQRLISRVPGISYYSATSGKSVMIAEPRQVQGVIVGNSEVLYEDCFDGGFKASLRYNLTLAGLEQDLILREQPPSPMDAGFGADEEVRLQLITEFLQAPQPQVREVVISTETDPQKREAMHEPDFTDQLLDFGAMQITHGVAFDLGQEQVGALANPAVGKHWDVIDARTVLFEEVRLAEVARLLLNLPVRPQAAVSRKSKSALVASRKEILPALKPALRSGKEMLMAQHPVPPGKGLVIDYGILSSMTNIIFQADTTYFLTNGVDANLSGTTTLEGGSVIKFDKYTTPETVRVNVLVPLLCKTSSYRPAIFTAKDDDSVGEVLPFSNGVPTGYYAYRALNCYVNQANNFVHDVRFNNAVIGCDFYGNSGHTLRHAQFGNCNTPVEAFNAGSVALQNMLVYKAVIVIDSSTTTISGEHLTVNASGNTSTALFYNVTNSTFSVTNSLFVNVTNLGTITSVSNATNSNASTFQTVGAGNYYLATGSAYRNAGTTAINAQVLADLKSRTTYPPTVMTNAISASTTLSPQAQRDTDTLDLGYHYPAADFALGDCFINSGCTLSIQPGTVITAFSNGGIRPRAGSVLNCLGTVTSPVVVCRYENIQEQAITWGTSNYYYNVFFPDWTSSGGATGTFSFTQVPVVGGSRIVSLYTSTPNYQFTSLNVSDCQFFGGTIRFYVVSTAIHTLKNNLFRGSTIFFNGDGTIQCYNNLFWELAGAFTQTGSQYWTYTDNLFDQLLFNPQSMTYLTHNHNGYVNCNGYRLGSTANQDQIINGTFTYQSAGLGDYYYSSSGSPLVNAGSRAASAAGLYHHTTQTNQTKEAATTVDIGFHYVALNASNQPIDTDGDGLPDYAEDRNGNGTFDSGETDWQTSNSTVSGAAALQVFTLLK